MGSGNLQPGAGVQPNSPSRQLINTKDAGNGTWEVAGGVDRAWGARPEVVTIPGQATFVSHLRIGFSPGNGCSAGEGCSFEVCKPAVLGSPQQEQGCCNNDAELWLL